MRLAVYQMEATAGDTAVNIGKIEAAAKTAAADGASLLVTPELSVPGYGAGDKMDSLAEDLSGEQVTALTKISIENDIALIAGFAEKAGDVVFNSAVYINKETAPVVYRKSHLYGSYEKSHFRPETPQATMINHGGVQIGILICYDVEFPENVRRLAMAGANVVLVPTALPVGEYGPFIARTLVPARAFENQVVVAYTNHAGQDALFSYQGLSIVAAPDGTILGAAPEKGEAVFIVDIDLSKYTVSRQQNSYLADL